MAENTLYSYSINGVTFHDPLGGAIESSEVIEHLFNDAQIDSNSRIYNSSQLEFTGSAYAFICARMNELCHQFDITLTNFEGMQLQGTFFSYMITIDLQKKIATTQIKDTSWSSILRNRTSIKVFTGITHTISCEPIDLLIKNEVALFEPDGQPLVNEAFRYGFNAVDVLNFIVKYLTDNVMSVESQYLTDNPIAIFNAKALKKRNVFEDNEVPPPNQLYVYASFDEILTPLRKLKNLDFEITGNIINIEPEEFLYKNNVLLSLGDLPIDSVLNIDAKRLYDKVKAGSTQDGLDYDDIDENYNYIVFPKTFSEGFDETEFGSCSCESDKDNTLDLTTDIITDTNVIHKLNNMFSEFEVDGIVFIECENNGLNKLTATRTLIYNELGFERFYYNDGFRNPNVLQNWSQTINNCIRIVNPFDNVFKSACVIQPEELGVQECVNFYTPWQSGDGEYTGFVYYVDPNRTVPTPPLSTENVDIYNGWRLAPGNGAQPQDFFNTYSGYQIPFEAWYAFTATKFITSPDERNSLVVKFSIVVYENNSLTNEIYRVTQEKTYGHITELDDLVSVSTDVLKLSSGNVVLVQTFIDIDSVDSVIGNFKWLGGDFYYDTAKLSCVDLSDDTELTRPYLYKFDYNLCLSDYNVIRNNRRYALEVDGKKMWIAKIERGFDKSCSMVLSSNDLICKNICRTCDYIIPNATLDGNWIEYIFAEKYETNFNDGEGNPLGWSYPGPPIISFETTTDYPLDNFPTDEELNLASTYSGIVTTLTGESLAQLLYDKWLAIPTINKSRLVLNGRSLTVYISDITNIANLIITRATDQYLPVNNEDFFEYRTVSTNLTVVEDNFGVANFDLQVYIVETHPSLSLFVNINGVYELIPEIEIVDGVWQRLNSTDIITDYYFYNNDLEEIVLTGLVDSLCE